MMKHDGMDNAKINTSHCQKSLCCIATSCEHRFLPVTPSIQSIKTANSAYVDQLTIGIYQLPYRPPNYVLFL